VQGGTIEHKLTYGNGNGFYENSMTSLDKLCKRRVKKHYGKKVGVMVK
jgi:hypothetical protein